MQGQNGKSPPHQNGRGQDDEKRKAEAEQDSAPGRPERAGSEVHVPESGAPHENRKQQAVAGNRKLDHDIRAQGPPAAVDQPAEDHSPDREADKPVDAIQIQ